MSLEKKQLRRLNHLMYKHHNCAFSSYTREWCEETLNNMIKNTYWSDKKRLIRIKELVEIFQLGDKLQINKDELYSKWYNITHDKTLIKKQYTLKPIKEGRDNKGVIVGSGGHNINMVRYPKKVRKTAWKRFYRLFPHLKPDTNQ